MTGNVGVAQTRRECDDRKCGVGHTGESEAVKGTKPLHATRCESRGTHVARK